MAIEFIGLAAFAVALTVAYKRRKDAGTIPFVVVLSGQSNMAGRGGLAPKQGGGWVWDVDQLTATERSLSDVAAWSRIERMTANKTWEAAHEPMHWDIDTKKACGIGPGLVMARGLVEKLPSLFSTRAIKLVPCAVGGSRIEEWKQGAELYESMCERSQAAGKVDVYIWLQGESDALKEEDASVYASKLEEHFANVRKHLGKDVIIVLVLVCGLPEKLPFIKQVREAQMIVADRDRSILVVEPNEVSFRQDKVHFTTESQVELGNRLATVLADKVFPSIK